MQHGHTNLKFANNIIDLPILFTSYAHIISESV